MDIPLKARIKPGIVHFKVFPETTLGTGPIVETLRRIVEDDFFSVVEVGWMKDVKVRNEAAQLLQISNIEVAYAMQPAFFSQKLNLNSFDPGERRKALNQARNCIKEAEDLGARWLRVFSGKDPGDEKREEAKKILVDSLSQIAEWAREYGNPTLTLKVFDRDIDKEFLVGHFKDAKDVITELRKNYPDFYLLADLSHFPLLREDPREALTIVGDTVGAFQIGNCVWRDKHHPLYGDLQPRFSHPDGDIGVAQVRDFFRVLNDLGYLAPGKRVVVSAEVRPLLPGETSELIMVNAKRVMEEAWFEA